MVNEERTHGEDMDDQDGTEHDTPNELQISTEQPTVGSLGLCQRLYKYRGVICVLLSAFAFALENVLFRAVENDMHTTQVLFSTYLLKVCIPVPILTYKGYSVKPKSKVTFSLLVGRGIIGMIAFNALYFALRYIKVGDATAIALSTPVFVGIFARIFLKEPFGILDAVLTLVVIAGVSLISKPSFIFGGSEEKTISNLIGAGGASVSCICFALSCIFNRKLGLLQVSNFVNAFYYDFIGFLGSGILTFIVGVWSVPPCGSTRAILVAMGTIGCTGNCLREYSFSVEKSLLLGVLQTNEIIFAYLLEFLIFKVAPDLISLLGVCLLVSASLMTFIKNRRRN